MRSKLPFASPLIAVAAIAVSAMAGCASTDVESSTEYTDLLDERDALAADLEEVRAELDDVDDQLAVAESERDDAETALADAAAITDDLHAFLVLDVMNRVGLEEDAAECVADAFLDDAEARQAYLLLLDAQRADPAAAEEAFGRVSTVLESCGMSVPDPNAPAEIAPELAAVLGEVEVTGSPLPAFPDSGADPAVGLTAPVLSGADYSGAPVRIDAAADGPTMAIVVAHWCPHCNAEIPKLNQLRDEGRIPDGVNIVAVSSGVNPDRPNFPPDEWLDTVDWTFPVIADGIDPATGRFVGSNAFGTSGVPFVTMIDGDGVVVERWAGERDVDELAAALEVLAAG